MGTDLHVTAPEFIERFEHFAHEKFPMRKTSCSMKECTIWSFMRRWPAANCFGDYYTRKDLALAEPQLIARSKGNRNMGNDREFLIWVVSQCLLYIGCPHSLNA